MNTDTFWKLIESAQRKGEDGWIELDHNALIDRLAQFSAEEIQEFEHLFYLIQAKTYRADLWDAAYVVACGCGDDAFSDVRDWLIIQGQKIYEKVLEDPDCLAKVVPRKHRFDLYTEPLYLVAISAYERKTGQPIPDDGYRERPILIGKHLSEEEQQVKFPHIMEKLGKYSDEDFRASW